MIQSRTGPIASLIALFFAVCLGGCDGSGLLTEYSVVYKCSWHEEGSVPVDSQTYRRNDNVTILGPGDLKWAEHRFVAWNERSDGLGSIYQPRDTFTMQRTDLVLYSEWASAITDHSENFNDGVPDGIVVVYDSGLPWAVEDGAYRYPGGVGWVEERGTIALEAVSSHDVRIDADIRVERSYGDFYIFLNAEFRADEEFPLRGYRLDLYPQGGDNSHSKAWRYDYDAQSESANSVELQTQSNAYSANTWVHIVVERLSDDIVVSVDSDLVYWIRDSTYSGGQIGFGCWSSFSIDNIEVSPR